MKCCGQWLVYLAFRAVEWILRLLPLDVVFVFGGLLGRVVSWFMPGYRRIVRGNLEIAYGGVKGKRELDKMVADVFRLLGSNFLSSAKLPWMKPEAIRERVEVEGVDQIKETVSGQKGGLFAMCHMGCWEVFAQIASRLVESPQFGALYRPLGNQFLDGHVKRTRESAGVELLDRRGGVTRPLKLLNGGGSLGVLVDQHAGDMGVWIPFMGRLVSTSNLIGLLAKRSGAPVYTLGLSTTGRARWRVVIGEPMEPERFPGATELAVEVNQRLAGVIGASPADWFWVHRRWKTPRPKFLLRQTKRGISLPSDMKEEELKPFRILVRSPNWLGDACMAVPAVRALKRGRPDAEVTVLCPGKIAPLWKRVAEVDSVLELEGKSLLGARKVIRGAGHAFDVGLLLPNSTRTALEMRLGGVREVSGFLGSGRKWLMHSVVRDKRKPGPVRHHSQHYLTLVKGVGGDVSDVASLCAPLDRGGDAGGGGTRLGLVPGAEYGAAKRWPAERFGAVAKAVREARPEVEWTIFGVKGDAEVAGEVAMAGGVEGIENLAGKTTLDELMDELVRCRLLLTNDTGTMHLAALLGVKVVAIFGSTEPAWTSPLGDGHVIVRRHVECSPCFLRECVMPEFRCMEAVGVDEVAAAVLGQLGG
ncbi:MAG: glycosyltransferase family 9 protein [Verrucomicrobiales bacterium]|nr:glycosyltransferase family 9 protein [Verrucomicrobiales bacterium]